MSELAKWDSFYGILGSAAATLIGLQFVVMTLVAERPSIHAAEAGAAFATPTIVHFCVVLLLSAFIHVPWEAIAIAAVLVGLMGFSGAVYTAIVTRRIWYRGRSQTQIKLPERKSEMDIRRIGSQPSAKGPSEWFTGTVRIDPLFQAPDPALVQGASVTFEPGARTAWHTHPLGQTLIVTAGCGWAQREGGPIEEIRPGDVIWFAPGEKHWHGATPITAMTHIAIQEKLDGKIVDWMEKVSDEQYKR